MVVIYRHDTNFSSLSGTRFMNKDGRVEAAWSFTLATTGFLLARLNA